MFCATVVSICRWPDNTLPQGLALGFGMDGLLPTFGILLPVAPKTMGLGEFPQSGPFGSDAENFVNQLEADRRFPPSADEIWEATVKEAREGTASPLVLRHDMDQFFGRGRWRPLPRHVVWQTQKWRSIDDGKRARTNALTTVCETIVCIPPEFVPLTLRRLACILQKKSGTLPPWFQPVMSTEDWWKGCRQTFPTVQHMGLATIAVMHPRTR